MGINVRASQLINKFTVSTNGTVFIGYSYKNDTGKSTFNLYTYKNNSWNKLPSYQMNSSNGEYYISNLFLDEMGNYYVNTNKSLYKLKYSEWKNIADTDSMKIFTISNDNIYSTTNSYNPDKYNLIKSTLYSNQPIIQSISLKDNPYNPVCATSLDGNNTIVATSYEHSDIVKKSIKFKAFNLDKSIASSVSDLASNFSKLISTFSGDNNDNDNSQNVEIDTNNIKDKNSGITSWQSNVSCSSSQKYAYFYKLSYASQYLYLIKVPK